MKLKNVLIAIGAGVVIYAAYKYYTKDSKKETAKVGGTTDREKAPDERVSDKKVDIKHKQDHTAPTDLPAPKKARLNQDSANKLALRIYEFTIKAENGTITSDESKMAKSYTTLLEENNYKYANSPKIGVYAQDLTKETGKA